MSKRTSRYRLGIPVTSHVSIGSDIIHGMPNCDGAALDKASYTDSPVFARAIQDLEGGVFLNIVSAVTGPEVYLKALSMARNVARQSLPLIPKSSSITITRSSGQPKASNRSFRFAFHLTIEKQLLRACPKTQFARASREDGQVG